jgi:hypothetical protein
MRLHQLLLRILKWSVTLAVLAALGVAAYVIHTEVQREREQEAAGDKVGGPRRAKGGVVTLGRSLAEFHGVRDEAAQACSWQERVPVYGRVVPNPLATVELRSAFAGTLRAAPGTAWPAPGSRVRAGQVLGWIDMRVGPQEQLDVQAKRDDARARYLGAEKVRQVQQARVDRLNEKPQSVAYREREEALVDLLKAQTEAATAKAALNLWQQALDEIDRHRERAQDGRDPAPESAERQAALRIVGLPFLPAAARGLIACLPCGSTGAWSQPLKVPIDGEVSELAATPGMVIEAGGLVARVVDGRRPLVRLDLPPEVLAAGPEPKVDLFAVVAGPVALRGAFNRSAPGDTAQPVPAALVGAAARLDAASQFAGYFYQVVPDEITPGITGIRTGGVDWRPPLSIKAYLAVAGAQVRSAVAVPYTALLYHQGRALVYVRLEPGKYERREVQVLGRQGNRWVLASGVKAGERVVSHQAQLLLSEEFRTDVDND